MPRILTFVLALICIATAAPTRAQTPPWPTKLVRMVVPFAPGGTVDILARFLSDRLGSTLGQPFIIENRPGAGGNIGTEMVVRAQNDGYTFLVSGSPTHVVNPHLYKLSYDPLQDFAPIALIATAPNLLVVTPSLQINSVDDLVKLARSKPGQFSYSSAGNGTSGHLAGELLSRLAGMDVQHVPFRGQADAITGVIRGDVAFAFVTIPGTLQQVKAGRLQAIAISSTARTNLAPEIPTVAQAGFPDFEVLAWYGIYAPRGIAPDITARFTRELDKIMQEPATQEKLQMLGAEARFLTDRAFADFMVKDSAKWGKVIRDSGMKAN